VKPIAPFVFLFFAVNFLFGCDARAVDLEPASTMQPKAQKVTQTCKPGHTFMRRAGAGLGYDTNTRPPIETIQSGPGSGPGGGPGGGSLSQPLIDVSQSDTVTSANASLKHGYCLTSLADEIAILWVSRFNIQAHNYLDLTGADELSVNLSTGPTMSSDWLWQVAPALDVEHGTLQGEPYRKRIGVSSHQLWNIAHNWQAGFSVSTGRVEFDQVPNSLHVEGHDKSLHVETSILLSHLYRVKLGASYISQSSSDANLSFDSNAYQIAFSRWHPLNCDAHLRFYIERSDYEALTPSGNSRTDELHGIELGGCAVISSDWTAAVSVQRTISDSNVVEFDYRKALLRLSLQYQF